MGVEDSVSSLASHIAHDSLETSQIGCVKGTGEPSSRGRDALHEEGNTERVHAFS
jgi:hypothetical protein